MVVSEGEYQAARSRLLDNLRDIEAAEQSYMDFLVDVTLQAAQDLHTDFDRAYDLIPFWINYPPKQRGRMPTGTSVPWSEVGEKTLSAHLLRAIWQKDSSVAFPGLPYGGDIRFATENAMIHFDIKMTGPNDNPNEVVVPPQQISGDGIRWESGVVNSLGEAIGPRARMIFQPRLPPFYILEGRILVCLTYFLKAVYTVQALGIQPLDYLEVVCVPNGLLLYDGPKYALTPGLFIPGKDDQTKPPTDKRTRVRLDPLASLDGNWRSVKIQRTEGEWQAIPRSV